MADKKYDIILFDLDGTLTDSKLGITKSVQFALESFGIEEKCLDNLEKFIGPPLKESFMNFYGFDESDANRAVVKYREYYSVKGIFENTVYPNIPELLDRLCSDGKVLIVATSKPTIFAEKILNHFDISKYFSKVVGSNLDGSRVKKVEIINHILVEENICKNNNVVMIGDRKHDIIGAKEAGVDSIGVLYGYGSLEELECYEPNYIAKSVLSLEEILL